MLFILKNSFGLSLGISPPTIIFEEEDIKKQDYKEIIIFNPNDEGFFIISESKNYRIVPKNFFISSENQKSVKIFADSCVNENITFFLNSNTNLFPALKLAVLCNKTIKENNLKIQENFNNYDLSAENSGIESLESELNKQKNKPNKMIGFFVSFSIVISGLLVYFSLNKREFRKIKRIVKEFLREETDF
ncbi:MAG: hypothetical protein QXU20_00215 [Candidatus Woesearchaeota archaeon]